MKEHTTPSKKKKLLEWDDPLPPNLALEFKAWINDIPFVAENSSPRSLFQNLGEKEEHKPPSLVLEKMGAFLPEFLL